MRQAAVNFFEQSWVVPAQQLQQELRLQRELKKKTCALEVDRATPPSTAVGAWVTPGVLAQLEVTHKKKEQKKAKQAEVKESNINKRAQKRVQMLRLGEEALKTLQGGEPLTSLKVPDLQGIITKLGGKPTGGKADLRAHAQRLVACNGTPLLALPAPAPAAAPAPATPVLALR